MNNAVRVRFAPSPTGGLHIGGLRTALFNYLFARKHGGRFILRIEDTDQGRFVEGAEAYINECLAWCGLKVDEGVAEGGKYGPYRQSLRKERYEEYARRLVEAGAAYYAFDTGAELEAARAADPNFLYGGKTRQKMRNSLTLSAAETKRLLEEDAVYVVRIKIPDDELIEFNDMVRGTVSVHSSQVDDKVLLKADGMPTYHLAVVVDDLEMEISHVLRGEEWLPSAPIHILLWQHLGNGKMPEFGHLPLILNPNGKGKLSKRDAEKLGFPVFAMDWKDRTTGKVIKGFKEQGFMPEALINFLAMLGWNDGTDREIFSLAELEEAFDIERIAKGGARFDFDKAKWFSKEWIARTGIDRLAELCLPYLQQAGYNVTAAQLQQVLPMVRERLTLLGDITTQAGYLFKRPQAYELDSILKKWDDTKAAFFSSWADTLNQELERTAEEARFKEAAAAAGLKAGDVLLPLRILLVGGKYGPDVFEIAAFLGGSEVKERITAGLAALATAAKNK